MKSSAIKPMYKEYSELKKLLNIKTVKDITVISKNIGIHQKTVQYSTYCYMKYVNMSNFVKDCSLLIISSILLGCKIADFVPKLDTIIENVFISCNLNLDEQEMKKYREEVVCLELEMCIALDFDFNIQDQYSKIINYSNELKREIDTNLEEIKQTDISIKSNNHKLIIQSLWIFMNDSLFYPFRFFFEQEIIFKACLYLSYMINNKADKAYQVLTDEHKLQILFVVEEMIDGYLQKHEYV